VCCSRELSSAFDRMCYQVKSVKEDLEREVSVVDEELHRLEETVSVAKVLR